ncbi:DJ-1/PfpI family protein [Fictibacillus phosphorivorans]|uniref:DJ-1/PfpI family protein n=1 Tax=Fictibacillus phosphorivorans TaxID=1221500 RepID=UPI003CEB191C
MKKSVLLYVYPNFKEFEVSVTLSVLKKRFDLHVFTQVTGQVKSDCGILIQPTIKFKNIRPWEYEMLILPGGDSLGPLSPYLVKLLKDFNSEQIRIAAIGEGVSLLSRAGLLDGRTYTTSSPTAPYPEGHFVNKSVVEDKNFITAKANAFLDLGLLIGKRMNCIENVEEYNFYKGIR